MPIDWEDDYCDAGHVIKTLECGECAAARAEKAEADLKEALEALREVLEKQGRTFPPNYRYDNNDIAKVKADRDALRTERYWIEGRIKAVLAAHPEGTKGDGT